MKKVICWVDENLKFAGFFESREELIDLLKETAFEGYNQKEFTHAFNELLDYDSIYWVEIPVELWEKYRKNESSMLLQDIEDILPNWDEMEKEPVEYI